MSFDALFLRPGLTIVVVWAELPCSMILCDSRFAVDGRNANRISGSMNNLIENNRFVRVRLVAKDSGLSLEVHF